jgi:hypothetical protein
VHSLSTGGGIKLVVRSAGVSKPALEDHLTQVPAKAAASKSGSAGVSKPALEERHVPAMPCPCTRQHPSASVSIRQHSSAYVSIRQHTSAYVSVSKPALEECPCKPAYVSIRQRTSAYVSTGEHMSRVHETHPHTNTQGSRHTRKVQKASSACHCPLQQVCVTGFR